MITENSVTYQFIGNVTNADALGESVDLLPEGAVALENGSGTIVASADQTGNRVRVAQRLPGGQLVFSPYFTVTNGTYTAQAYSTPMEQISFLGYNGTAGALDTEDGREYILKVTLNHTQGVFNNTPMIKSVPGYLPEFAAGTAAGRLQYELSNIMQNSFIRQFSRTPNKSVKAERIFDGTVANPAGDGRLAYLTNGSTNVTFHVGANDGLDDSTQTFVADDIVSLPTDNGRTFTFSAVVLGAGAGRHLVTIGTTTLNVADGGTAAQNATAIAAAINGSSALEGKVTATAAAAVVTVTYNWSFKALPPVIVSTDDDVTFVNIDVTTTVGNAVRVAYKIPEAIAAGATAQLDKAWQGPTGYVAFREAGADASNHAGRTATADAIGAANNWGIMFSGQTPSNFKPVTETPYQVSFTLGFDKIRNASDVAFGLLTPALDDSRITYTQDSDAGLGTGQQVAYKEVYATMNEGNAQICAYPPTNYRRNGDTDAAYNTMVIRGTDSGYTTATTGQTPVSLFNIIINVNTGVAADWTALNTQLP